MVSALSAFDELVAVVERLRAPNGCPWDAEQTHRSLVKYLIEESYELVEAIETGSREDLLEELGDVLYQVLFHADLAAHTPGEEFDIQDVARQMTAKMIGRHPHVFGDATAHTAEEVMAVWDDLKSAEKPQRTSVLDGVPQSMPALALAEKILGKAGKVGISLPVEPCAVSIESEEYLGEVLLGIVAAGRAQGYDSERALRGALRVLQHDIRQSELTENEASTLPELNYGEPY